MINIWSTSESSTYMIRLNNKDIELPENEKKYLSWFPYYKNGKFWIVSLEIFLWKSFDKRYSFERFLTKDKLTSFCVNNCKKYMYDKKNLCIKQWKDSIIRYNLHDAQNRLKLCLLKICYWLLIWCVYKFKETSL